MFANIIEAGRHVEQQILESHASVRDVYASAWSVPRGLELAPKMTLSEPGNSYNVDDGMTNGWPLLMKPFQDSVG
jgi:hypothetical protein